MQTNDTRVITSLAYFGAQSPNYRDWETFGPQVLGCQLIEPGPDGAVRLRFDEMAYRLAIHPGEKNGVAYVGWQTMGEDAVKQLAKRITDYGVTVHQATTEEAATRKVRGYCWFLDPVSGVRHELIWGQLRPRARFRPGRAMSGFKTGDQGFGHVVFAVPDLEKSDRFWRDVLGFHLSDTVIGGPIFAHFYHINGRHHSLAMARAPGEKAAFLHLMMEVNALEDVGVAMDLCEDLDVPITRTLGCHTNDRMISFYLHSPAGFRIEYGFGGLDIDDLWEPRFFDRPSMWGHRPDITSDKPEIGDYQNWGLPRDHKELSPFLMIDSPAPRK